MMIRRYRKRDRRVLLGFDWRNVYVEDSFVLPAHRRLGIGKTMWWFLKREAW